jgi:putative Holliday junction resolvase
VGERRIGVAISDPDRHFALPLHSLDGRDQRAAIASIADLAREDEVGELVVGLPLSLSGEAGPQAQTTTAFAEALEQQLGLPVHLWDERLSTQEALRRVTPEPNRSRRERTRRLEADTDALAASIILQAYLDSHRTEAKGFD